MALIADLLMVAGALAAGFYCIVLSRRLAALKNAEGGIGQAVATLSAQVTELHSSVEAARSAAGKSNASLAELTGRAEAAAQRLELMVASMHDLPQAPTTRPMDAEPDEPVFAARARRSAGAAR